MKFKAFIPFLFLLFCDGRVESATFWDRPYDYFMSFGKSVAPSLMSIFDCMGAKEPWSCARDKAGKLLEGWEDEVNSERRSWQEAADAEVVQSGRSLEEMPSKIGSDVENTLASLAEMVHLGMARALRKHDSGGIDSITISAGGDKKKMKKKKPKPQILLHPMVVPLRKHNKEEKGRSFPNGRQSWVIGDRDGVESLAENVEAVEDVEESETGVEANADEGRGVLSDMWSMGNEALDAVAEHAMESENRDNGIEDKSSFEEQRGKKKKKKKAILKLLILGAVLKAKIGTLLQILSFKLQVKFFILAVIGLAINLARLWIDLKKKHSEQPQKVIYYEHAQHQHHYDHEDEHEHGWGPWSRSMDPNEETDIEVDVDLHNSPYRGQRPQYRPGVN